MQGRSGRFNRPAFDRRHVVADRGRNQRTVASPPSPLFEAVFFGSLDYTPNIEAVERLSNHIWPLVRQRIPDAAVAIAGRRAWGRVLRAVRSPGVHFMGEFERLDLVADRALLAVSPLLHGTGLQIKVLDAAQLGLAQVVSPAALQGFEPGFPCRVAEDDDAFAEAVVALVKDRGERDRLAASALQHVNRRYTVKAWSPTAERLMEPAISGDATPL